MASATKQPFTVVSVDALPDCEVESFIDHVSECSAQDASAEVCNRRQDAIVIAVFSQHLTDLAT